jgi:hypothetical protein
VSDESLNGTAKKRQRKRGLTWSQAVATLKKAAAALDQPGREHHDRERGLSFHRAAVFLDLQHPTRRRRK